MLPDVTTYVKTSADISPYQIVLRMVLTNVMTSVTVHRVARRPPPSRSNPPAGWPAWLVEQRAEKGWKQQDVFDKVRAHFGWGPTSLSLYGDIERGKRPLTDADKVVLAAVFGKKSEDVPEPLETRVDPTLAQALSDLAEELAALRQERTAWERGVLAVIRSFRDGQVPIELLDALAPQPHEGAQQ